MKDWPSNALNSPFPPAESMREELSNHFAGSLMGDASERVQIPEKHGYSMALDNSLVWIQRDSYPQSIGVERMCRLPRWRFAPIDGDMMRNPYSDPDMSA
jgi:hypothetical protein